MNVDFFGNVGEEGSANDTFQSYDMVILIANFYNPTTHQSFGRYTSEMIEYNQEVVLFAPRIVELSRVSGMSGMMTFPFAPRPSTVMEDSVALLQPLRVAMNFRFGPQRRNGSRGGGSCFLSVAAGPGGGWENLNGKDDQPLEPLHFLNCFALSSAGGEGGGGRSGGGGGERNRKKSTNVFNIETTSSTLNTIPYAAPFVDPENHSSGKTRLVQLLDTISFVIQIQTSGGKHVPLVPQKGSFDGTHGIDFSFQFTVDDEDASTFPEKCTIYGIKDGNTIFNFIECSLSRLSAGAAAEGFTLDNIESPSFDVRAQSTHPGGIRNHVLNEVGQYVCCAGVLVRKKTVDPTQWTLSIGCMQGSDEVGNPTVLHSYLSIASRADVGGGVGF